MEERSPSVKRANRDQHGHFRPGHTLPGPGNPHVRQTARLRSALLSAVDPEDIEAVIAKLLEKALAGDVAAIKELLDRTIGRTPLKAEIGFTENEPGPFTQFAGLHPAELDALTQLLERAVSGNAKLLEQSEEHDQIES
jgi:hypothetical protein